MKLAGKQISCCWKTATQDLASDVKEAFAPHLTNDSAIEIQKIAAWRCFYAFIQYYSNLNSRLLSELELSCHHLFFGTLKITLFLGLYNRSLCRRWFKKEEVYHTVILVLFSCTLFLSSFNIIWILPWILHLIPFPFICASIQTTQA